MCFSSLFAKITVAGAGVIIGAVTAAVVAAPGRSAVQPVRVVIVPGLKVAQLRALEPRAAVGLLVPGAGPVTSPARARAALVTGRVRNSLRGGVPRGPRLISVETAAAPPRSGPAIVLALPQGGERRNDRRYPVAIISRGSRGLLRSESTRIPGLVSIADIAPTALGRQGRLRARAERDPVGDLVSLDRRIAANGESRPRAWLLAAGLTLLLAGAFARAALLAFAAVPLANVALGVAGVSRPWLVVLVFALAVGAAAPLARLVRTPAAIGLLFLGVVAVVATALALDPVAVALSPLGPTQNSRFYGFSNLLESVLLLPALAAAALLAAPLGVVGFLLAAVPALIAVGASRLGADGGGAIVLAVGYAVLAVELAGLRRRALVAALAAGAALVLLLVALDIVSGGSSHLTRTVAGGPAEIASALGDRVSLAYLRATWHRYIAAAVLASALALTWRLARLPRLALERRGRALLLALAAAVGVSLLLNDSPLEVAVLGLVSYLALEAYLRQDSARREPALSSPLRLGRAASG